MARSTDSGVAMRRLSIARMGLERLGRMRLFAKGQAFALLKFAREIYIDIYGQQADIALARLAGSAP